MSISYSSSVTSSFISTIDHLPADVVRSLWLLQSINIKIDNLKSELNLLLNSLPQNQAKVPELFAKISYLSREATQESKALYDQLVAHNLTLSEEIDQLVALQEKLENIDQNKHGNKQLRDKLTEHYTQNPLISLAEALKEHQLKSKLSPRKNGSLISKISKIKEPKLMKMPKKSQRLVKERTPVRVSKHRDANGSTGRNVNVKSTRPATNDKLVSSTGSTDESSTFEPVKAFKLYADDGERYCFCKQGSFGDMIGCDNEISCPNGEWFHYKCVGLNNRVEALKYTVGKEKWFCSEGCRQAYEQSKQKPAPKKKKKRARW